jgi:hypothetical protein
MQRIVGIVEHLQMHTWLGSEIAACVRTGCAGLEPLPDASKARMTFFRSPSGVVGVGSAGGPAPAKFSSMLLARAMGLSACKRLL